MNLTPKKSELEVGCHKEQREHDEIVKKMQKKAKILEDHNVAEREGALFCYHVVL